MTTSNGLLGLFPAILARLRRSVERRRYNASNRAEYLRAQGVQVGENCSIVPADLGTTEPYLIRIGNHVGIANGVQFITHDGGPFIFRQEFPDLQVFGPIVIEDNCVIGQNVLLFPNVRIGPNAIVGAGSVVISDVPPNSIVMGVPARKIGDVDRYREKCLDRWREQRPADIEIGPGETWWTTPHFERNRGRLREHLQRVFAKELGGKVSERPPSTSGET